MTKKELAGMIGSFTWGFSREFFIRTQIGNFTWSSPKFLGGTGKIIPFDGDCGQWMKSEGLVVIRNEGIHNIGEYCGVFKLVQTQKPVGNRTNNRERGPQCTFSNHINLGCTEDQFTRWKRRAENLDMSTPEWIRTQLDRAS